MLTVLQEYKFWVVLEKLDLALSWVTRSWAAQFWLEIRMQPELPANLPRASYLQMILSCPLAISSSRANLPVLIPKFIPKFCNCSTSFHCYVLYGLYFLSLHLFSDCLQKGTSRNSTAGFTDLTLFPVSLY